MNLRTIVVMALTLTICVGTTEGFTNHGLYWGIEIGDRLDYHMVVCYPNSTHNKDIDYYVLVDDLPSIEDNLANIPRIREIAAFIENFSSFYFTNNTRITEEYELRMSWSAYPVGNWSLINDLVNLSMSDSIEFQFIEASNFNTLTEWGYTQTYIAMGIEYTHTLLYLKENGVMSYYYLSAERTDGSVSSTQIIIEGYINPIPVVISFASIGLLVGILGFFIMKSRSASKDRIL